MRLFLLPCSLLLVSCAQAAVVHVAAETLAPVDEDDWSVPLRRCFSSSEYGVGVYDGAERCTLEFAVPLSPGRKLVRVGVLHEDDAFDPEIAASLQVRDVTDGSNALIASEKDESSGNLTVLNTLWLEPHYTIGLHDAPFVRVGVRGDTRVLTLTYEYE